MIKIRKFKLSDIDTNYLTWLNNKFLMRFSRHSKKKFTKKNATDNYKRIKKRKHFFLLVYLRNKKTENKIGTLIGYTNKSNQSCNLGILISKQAKGYGFIAWKMAISYIFNKGYKSITAGTLTANQAMVKIFKKSGMRLITKKKVYYENFKKIRRVETYKLLRN
jgi:RimJ/RimL family protein N-acetyltransferase